MASDDSRYHAHPHTEQRSSSIFRRQPQVFSSQKKLKKPILNRTL